MQTRISQLLAITSLVMGQAFAASTPAPAAAPQESAADIDYGDLYVVQKREIPKQAWQAVLGYSYGFSNPYIGIHGANLQLTRRVWDFIHVGVYGAFYGANDKDLASRLSATLGAQSIETQIYRPFYTAQATIVLVPLTGMLNWISTSAVDFDLPVILGVGASRYRETTAIIPTFRFGIAPQAMLNPHFGFQLGLQTQFEHFGGGDWQSRFEAFVGVVGRI